MIYEELPRGQAQIAYYLPTVPAMRYLNCCTMAGWHCCNELYHQTYPKGTTHPLVIYTIQGKGIIKINSKNYTLRKDSIVIVPAKIPIKYQTDSQTGCWEFYWLNLDGENMLSTSQKLWQDDCFFVEKIPPMQNEFEKLMKESYSEPERSVIIGRIFNAFTLEAVFGINPKSSVVERILGFLSENYMEKIDLQQLSDKFYLSQNQIIRIVRARTGYTPHEYLTRFRLTKACEFLQATQRPICEIGHLVGYDNNSHFSAAFRSLYGISPGEYRAHFSK